MSGPAVAMSGWLLEATAATTAAIATTETHGIAGWIRATCRWKKTLQARPAPTGSSTICTIDSAIDPAGTRM